MGRRVRKRVETYDGSSWPETSDELFIYDGWNIVMVIDANASDVNATAAITRKYTWGLDLSGTIHRAGGIGGLLAAVETQGEHQGTYWFFYDANGNVGQILDATSLQTIGIAARYEYDPYGNLIASSGAYATANPFRFSTKWFDVETGLGNWGYRYYSPHLGRWISRDPIGEEGGLNLKAFVTNQPTNTLDALGLWKICRAGLKRAVAEAEEGDTVLKLAEMLSLDENEYRKWLKQIRGRVAVPSSADSKVPEGCRYWVPNTVGIVLGGEQPGGDPYVVTGWQSDAKAFGERLRKAGFHVISGRLSKEKTIEILEMEELLGFVFVGHGGTDTGDLIIKFATDPKKEQNVTVAQKNYRSTLTRYNSQGEESGSVELHKLAFMYLYACYTGNKSQEKKPLPSAWVKNVSPRGHFVGFVGGVNSWNEAEQKYSSGSSPSFLPPPPRSCFDSDIIMPAH